jgi:hypothetical protein
VGSAAMAATLGMTGLVLAVSGTPASADTGGNCQARVGHQSRTGPDYYRPEGYCTSLNADSKARGALDLSFAPDAYTAWFTQTKVWKVGGWDDYVGVNGAYPQIRAV